jgi:prefoldin subunit 5
MSDIKNQHSEYFFPENNNVKSKIEKLDEIIVTTDDKYHGGGKVKTKDYNKNIKFTNDNFSKLLDEITNLKLIIKNMADRIEILEEKINKDK